MDVVLLGLVVALLAVATYLAWKRKKFVDRVNAIPGLNSGFLTGDLVMVAKHNFGTLIIINIQLH